MSSLVDPWAVENGQSGFFEILPHLESLGQRYFRHLKCPARKADAIQEMRALAWKWFLRLSQRGKNPAHFIHAFVCYLARAVKSGRCVVGKSRFKEAMHPASQKRRGFIVESFPVGGAPRVDYLRDALVDNTVTPPPMPQVSVSTSLAGSPGKRIEIAAS